MLYLRNVLLCTVALGVAATLSGCGRSPAIQDQPKATGTETQPQAQPAAPAHEGHEAQMGAGDTQQERVAKGLAELSDEDRALAEKQKICPVSNELLGEHGKPIKITVKGQTVFLCCAGCEELINKDPDKYLAKLKTTDAK